MTNSLPNLIHLFFHDWRPASGTLHATILSYWDTWRLLLRFVAERRHRDVARLSLEDLSDKEALAFLDHVEKDRGAIIATRNCRLAALHSFFGFVADREPLAAGQCAAILRIPSKRSPKRSVSYLESEELSVLLNQPDRNNKLGQRDHLLFALRFASMGKDAKNRLLQAQRSRTGRTDLS